MTSFNQKLIDESINTKVASWSHLEFHQPKIIEMCESASKDRSQGMIAPKAYPQHTMFDSDIESIKQSTIEERLKFLIIHGFTGECIYSQAGINK